MIAASQIAAVITDPRLADNPIVECNEAFEHLTGYSRDEVLGQNCRFLQGTDTEPQVIRDLHAGIETCRPVLAVIQNYKKDGTPFKNAVTVAPIFDDDGRIEYYLGSQFELTEPSDSAADSRRSRAVALVEQLTKRQREVLVLLAAGNRNKQIAFELGISERTVHLHRGELMKALGARTTSEIIRIAVEAGA